MDTKTTKEVSEITGLTQGYIAELCAAGKVPGAIKRGKMWFVPEQSIKIIIIITGAHIKKTKNKNDFATPECKSDETLAQSNSDEAVS